MKPRKNLDVRAWIVGHGLTYGEVAKELSMSNVTFSGMLQMELTDDVKRAILQAAERVFERNSKGNEDEEDLLTDRDKALLPG